MSFDTSGFHSLMKGIICFGMYYNATKDYFRSIGKSRFGQGFRDQARCQALINMGYETVITLNNGEFTQSKVGEHIKANFNYRKSVQKEIDSLYPLGLVVSAIVLDYFYSPVYIIL
jgi:hypothetical protein